MIFTGGENNKCKDSQVGTIQASVARSTDTCAANASYHYIRSGMIKKVSKAGWSSSKEYTALPEHLQSMLLNFVNNSVLSIYRQWIENGKQQSVEEMIEITNRLVLGGVNGFFR